MPTWWLFKRSYETCVCVEGYSWHGNAQFDLVAWNTSGEAQTPNWTHCKLVVHCLRCFQNEGFNYFNAVHGTNLSVTCLQNCMVKHRRCEWCRVLVFSTQDLRVFRKHYRNKCHVCRETQTLNADILTKHPQRLHTFACWTGYLPEWPESPNPEVDNPMSKLGICYSPDLNQQNCLAGPHWVRILQLQLSLHVLKYFTGRGAVVNWLA